MKRRWNTEAASGGGEEGSVHTFAFSGACGAGGHQDSLLAARASPSAVPHADQSGIETYQTWGVPVGSFGGAFDSDYQQEQEDNPTPLKRQRAYFEQEDGPAHFFPLLDSNPHIHSTGMSTSAGLEDVNVRERDNNTGPLPIVRQMFLRRRNELAATEELDAAPALDDFCDPNGTVVVQLLTGRRLHCAVPQFGSVFSLKERVCEQEGIPPEQQRLVFQGRLLPDAVSLQECGLGDGDVVHLMLALRGG
jgi:ubiquitin-like protein Nedd8